MTRLAAPTDELVMLAGEGDQRAFSRFYDATSTLVFSIVLRVLRDRAQAEEVAQDVYLEAWTSAARYDAKLASANTWIITMAHRRAVDRVRSSQASRNRDMKIGIRDLPREHDHVAEEVEVHSEFARARAALATLTDLQREAVSLVYFEGYTQTEVAELLQTPIGTIKTRLRDGLLRMRAKMTSAG